MTIDYTYDYNRDFIHSDYEEHEEMIMKKGAKFRQFYKNNIKHFTEKELSLFLPDVALYLSENHKISGEYTFVIMNASGSSGGYFTIEALDGRFDLITFLTKLRMHIGNSRAVEGGRGGLLHALYLDEV